MKNKKVNDMLNRYNFSSAGINALIADATLEYDPRDVLMAMSIASTLLYILRYTDSVESVAAGIGGAIADIPGQVASAVGGSGGGGAAAAVPAAVAMI